MGFIKRLFLRRVSEVEMEDEVSRRVGVPIVEERLNEVFGVLINNSEDVEGVRVFSGDDGVEILISVDIDIKKFR